jgi:molybdate transport system substrate-binding protein
MKKMERMLLLSAGALLAVLPVFGADTKKSKAGAGTEIIIAAAASLTDAMNEEIALYAKKEPSVKVTPTYGSSGTLRKQIEQGAPADIFISANESHMDALKTAGLIDNSTAKNMFENKVVLITPKDSRAGLKTYGDCATDKVSRIALGIPESVPAGDYAKQVFTTLNIWDKVSAKAVFAKDVRQVLTYVEQGEVDAGVVYATDAAISQKITVVCEAPEGSCKPIIYPGAVVKDSAHADIAKAFFAFLSTDEAGRIFAKYGFALVK